LLSSQLANSGTVARTAQARSQDPDQARDLPRSASFVVDMASPYSSLLQTLTATGWDG
jgi:hypothetical protein